VRRSAAARPRGRAPSQSHPPGPTRRHAPAPPHPPTPHPPSNTPSPQPHPTPGSPRRWRRRTSWCTTRWPTPGQATPRRAARRRSSTRPRKCARSSRLATAAAGACNPLRRRVAAWGRAGGGRGRPGLVPSALTRPRAGPRSDRRRRVGQPRRPAAGQRRRRFEPQLHEMPQYARTEVCGAHACTRASARGPLEIMRPSFRAEPGGTRSPGCDFGPHDAALLRQSYPQTPTHIPPALPVRLPSTKPVARPRPRPPAPRAPSARGSTRMADPGRSVVPRAGLAAALVLLAASAASARASGQAAGASAAARAVRGAAAPAAQPRRLLQYPFPKDAFDRRSMAGAAGGARAGGQSGEVGGLTNPDRPALGKRSASMEGEAGAAAGSAGRARPAAAPSCRRARGGAPLARPDPPPPRLPCAFPPPCPSPVRLPSPTQTWC
jgi:hypothetical protein